MPPFSIISTPASSNPQSPAASLASPTSEDPPTISQGGNAFTSILKSFGRGVVKASSSVTPVQTEAITDAGIVRARKTGGSSRHAGVRPSRNISEAAAAAILAREVVDEEYEYMVQRNHDTHNSIPLAGPSRGGFVSRLHAPPTALPSRALPPVTTPASPPPSKDPSIKSPTSPTVPLPNVGSPPVASSSSTPLPATLGISLPAPMSTALEQAALEPLDDEGPVPPPSKILTRLTALVQTSPDPHPLLPVLRLLAASVALYPFPPPTLAAASLSAALGSYATTPRTESPVSAVPVTPLGIAPSPTPLQIYLSQAHLLQRSADTTTRIVLLELLLSCVKATLGSTGGIKESEKAIYWEEARRWADQARVNVDDRAGHQRWILPDADREGIVAILSALTRGGRDLSDLPGLVALLCTFVSDALPTVPPPSPLFDPELATPFLRRPPAPAPHSSAMALLISLHKFSAPHIYSASTLMALRATLEVARSQNERDIGGQTDTGVLALLGAVVRYGEVKTGGKLRRHGKKSADALDGIGETEGDEVLREVIAVVSRMIGCEGLVGVVEVGAHVKTLPKMLDAPLRPSILPPLALELMRDLLRSPAHQALKSLRNSLVAPPPTTPRPPAPVLLLVGALRSLRNALLEHAADTEASSSRETSSLLVGETRWPSMLSLGLPFLWNGLCRVMQWESEYVDAEVLGLITERLEASERASVRADGDKSGVGFEEWDMAIEVLGKAARHIAAWEEKKQRRWILEDVSLAGEGLPVEDDAATTFTPRTTVLSAFKTLLHKVLTAWKAPDFTGPSERLFTLLLELAPHLSEREAISVLDQCERAGLCLPSHPVWLERTQAVLKAFHTLPGKVPSGHKTSAATRKRALQLLASVHAQVRQLGELQDKSVDRVFLPLLEATLEAEADASVAGDLIDLVLEAAKDDLHDEGEDGSKTSGVFSRISDLLLKLAKGAVGSADRYSTSVLPPKGRLGGGLGSISRHARDPTLSSGTLRAAPSISRPLKTTLQSDPHSVSLLAILGLISLFHFCLTRSTRSSSARGIPLFRDLLALAVPSASPPSADSPRPEIVTVTVRARFVILQWLVRLRADANHRIHLIQDVDISGAATIISRLGVVPDAATEALVEAATRGGAEEGHRAEIRGRSARGQEGMRPDREASSSRTRLGSEERLPSVRAPSRGRPAPPPSAPALSGTPLLWTVPELLPFKGDFATVAIGTTGLASFDHNRMRDWTEEEDPGTGLMKTKELEEVIPPEHEWMLVLPVSEYLGALNRLLSHEVEWELVSYVLCHLPEQLSNKHFACGPRAGQQLHALRRQLCDGLRGEDRIFLADVVVPAGVKRAEVNALAYHCLTSLVAYRSLFKKSQQDEMVETFIYGLNNPRDTAKPCIHALAMACFELRPSMTKYLAEIVRQLQKIISSATLGVHILEFIAAVGQEPSLYANFTEQDFQTVFGIALKYIQAHNDRVGNIVPEVRVIPGEELSYAFSQYVFLLAYYSIAAWYMALRLSERPKYVAFLIRRLVQANEGRPEIDEATEVCFDMLARYAYSNADPRPRQSSFDKIITAGRASSAVAKTWIIGTALVSIKNLESPAWVQVTIRRASGVVKMLWELQNVSGVATSSDYDLIAMHLRHREAAPLASATIGSAISEALAALPPAASLAPPRLGRRARAASFSSGDSTPAAAQSILASTLATVLNSGAAAASQPTLESGPLAVDPSFFALQLSSIPDFGAPGPPLLVPSDPQYQRGINILDTMPVVDFHKVGVLYAGPGQTTEGEILGNTHGSRAYIELISGLGRLVRLQGCRELDVYTGGLDAETDIDGKWTYVWDDDISQIVFHVATLMPTSPLTDPQSTLKKRHIGNDYVKIIFNDSGAEFAFDTLPGDFNFVNIVIQPHTPAGNPWVGPGMTNNAEFFKVSMQCRTGMPEIGPLGTFKMVTGSSLPSFVRQLSLHSNIFAQIYLATVGIEARQGTQKVEYSSNWRRRLQEIKRLRARLSAPSEAASPPRAMDLEEVESARTFTSWL